MRFLFAAHPTVGHTQALRAVGRALVLRGHAVRFAVTRLPRLPGVFPVPAPLRGAETLAADLEKDGFLVLPMPASLRSLWAASRIAVTRGYDELDWATRLFTADALAVARVLGRELDEHPVDVVAADFAYFGAWLAAERAGVPCASIFHSGLPFPADGYAPFGSPLGTHGGEAERREVDRRLDTISGRVDGAIGTARSELGLPPLAPGLLARPYATALNVLTTFEAFELPRPHLAQLAAGPLLWSGPCLGDRGAEDGHFPWARLEGPKPWIYVSLGTVFNDQPGIYAALLEGVHRAGARAVVAAGASYDAMRAHAAPDDVVVRFAPQVALLPHMTAVIGHGGNNSTNETLRAGKPLVVVPFGGEQIANARRVLALGVGAALDPEHLSVERVSDAVWAVQAPDVTARARALSLAVPAGDGAVLVADALEHLGVRKRLAATS